MTNKCDLERGVTLIDAVIGSALVLVAFVGIAGVFQLSIDVVTNNRARAGAIALANEWMEYVRSLEFDDVGTIGGIPAGVVPQSETVSLNGIPYTRRTTIQFVDDPYDGLGAADNFPTGSPVFVDYKAVRVAISWQSREGERTVYFVTRVEPQNGIEVACTSSCGTLSITVVNATSEPVVNAKVDVVNTNTSPAINLTTYTNIAGQVVLAGAPVAAGYQVTVSKPGYNSTQTYGADAQNPSPSPPHQQVFQNQTTSLVFAPLTSGVDVLASKTVYTYSAIATSTWNETFANESQIASSTNVAVVSGMARLSGGEGSYPSYGELETTVIGPSYIAKWKTFNWSGSTPAGTSIAFRFYDANDVIVPDSAFPGNAAGFTASSVDLSGLSTSTYPSIRLHPQLTTNDASTTPSIDSYSILYDYGPVPLPSITFHMRGQDKVIGLGPPPIYKYEADSTTNAEGIKTLQNLEWDSYTVSFPAHPSYAVASACNPQPEYLAPGFSQTSRFYLAPVAGNALGVEVSAGGALLSGATAVLSKTGYAATSTTMCGQSYFNYLSAGTYTLTVSATGYQTFTDPNVSVSGITRQQIELNP
ncbi:carboxypeptidase regulatory-like domain-containing protein [Candidatus Kaiserbacteria bacterium]|nr:carboxypeptidase regulatory-like domain-containing protein [Candidatus Kaiserbacteria bacterium]